jgi:hypothetical protein
MLKLTCDTTIGSFNFAGVTEIEVNSSWENLTDTATITFPRLLKWQGRELATGPNPLLKRGDKVLVRIGYDGENTEVFRGVIRDITGEVPVKLICEDEMYLLKSGEKTLSYKDTSTAEIVKDIVGGTVPYKVVADVKTGPFRISKATPAKVLEYLREHYFVRAWMRAGTLYVGLAYVPELQRTSKIRFDRNIISHTLEYREKDSVKLSLKAVIVKPGNGSETVEIGDTDGEKRTFHYYNISISEAKKMLEKEIERLRYTGYRGSFVTFGKPDIRHGDVVKITDPIYPERSGSYLVKSVKINFGQTGYRQTCELETKV